MLLAALERNQPLWPYGGFPFGSLPTRRGCAKATGFPPNQSIETRKPRLETSFKGKLVWVKIKPPGSYSLLPFTRATHFGGFQLLTRLRISPKEWTDPLHRGTRRRPRLVDTFPWFPLVSFTRVGWIGGLVVKGFPICPLQTTKGYLICTGNKATNPKSTDAKAIEGLRSCSSLGLPPEPLSHNSGERKTTVFLKWPAAVHFPWEPKQQNLFQGSLENKTASNNQMFSRKQIAFLKCSTTPLFHPD